MTGTEGSNPTSARQPLRSHEDLEAYKLSMRLLVQVHELCKTLPRKEKYELVSQMRRASKSIPANIAEGFGKRTMVKEFKQYMRTAMASANEMEPHVRIAETLGYLDGKKAADLVDGYNHIGRQLNRLIASWKRY
jgi:four helix bundle protein